MIFEKRYNKKCFDFFVKEYYNGSVFGGWMEGISGGSRIPSLERKHMVFENSKVKGRMLCVFGFP